METFLSLAIFIITIKFIVREWEKNTRKKRYNKPYNKPQKKEPYKPKEYTNSLYKTIKNYNNKPKYYTQQYNNQQSNIISVTKIGEHFNIPAISINKIFLRIGWIEESGKWKIATELGKNQGAVEKYDTRNKMKYVMWDINILENENFIEAIKELQKKPYKRMTHIEKIEKGKNYEEYVANHYRRLGYTVIENGKKKGVKMVELI